MVEKNDSEETYHLSVGGSEAGIQIFFSRLERDRV